MQAFNYFIQFLGYCSFAGICCMALYFTPMVGRILYDQRQAKKRRLQAQMQANIEYIKTHQTYSAS